MWNVELVGFADYIIMNYSIKNIIQYLFPLVIGTSSLVYSDAPTSSTASTQSVILFNIAFLPSGTASYAVNINY